MHSLQMDMACTSKSKNNTITKIENIDVLQKILNSIIMDYYVSKTSVSIEGGYPCYQKNFIENFSIPDLSEDKIEKIRKFSTQEEIDEYLVDLYHINLPVPNLRTYIASKSSMNPV
jgi:adenine-specific DNA-methyltransferase